MADPAWLERVVETTPHWPHGPVQLSSIARIGAEHGLSGQAFRAAGEAGGQAVSVVVKIEDAASTERALRFHAAVGTLEGDIPYCFGGFVDADTDSGVLVLEDVRPVVQGDVLHPPAASWLRSAVGVLARLHAVSWRGSDGEHPAGLPRWAVEPWDAERWQDRIRRARRRFPRLLTPSIAGRLDSLPAQLDAGLERVRGGPASWIHGDAHLDNFVWRPDGTAVLLDWSGARIGPPAVDLGPLLIDTSDHDGIGPEDLLEAYAEALVAAGRSRADAELVLAAIEPAMLPLLRGILGWAGRPEPEPVQVRMAALREQTLRRARRWLERSVRLAPG